MITNIDELVEKEERDSFQLRGKEYVIPDLPFILAIELSEKSREIQEAIETADVTRIMRKTMEVVTKVLPEFTEEFIEEHNITVVEMTHISNCINRVGREDTSDETELGFYRKKYKDEFRKKEEEKNGNATNGKS